MLLRVGSRCRVWGAVRRCALDSALSEQVGGEWAGGRPPACHREEARPLGRERQVE